MNRSAFNNSVSTQNYQNAAWPFHSLTGIYKATGKNNIKKH